MPNHLYTMLSMGLTEQWKMVEYMNFYQIEDSYIPPFSTIQSDPFFIQDEGVYYSADGRMHDCVTVEWSR